jgi:hypothetical protein
MEIRKIPYHDEFWGAKILSYETEVEESYKGEVFDMLYNEIVSEITDEIPDTMEVEDGELEVEIDPKEYLTEEQIKFLEDLIKLVWNYTIVKYHNHGKYEVIPIDDFEPSDDYVEIAWKDVSEGYIERFINEIVRRVSKR